MFRGFVQRSFEAKLKRPAATLLTAIYFSFFHIFIYILSPPLFLFLFIPYLGISLVLGLVRNWRNDILAAAVLHIVYNTVQTIVLFFIFM
jgi:membrane protease YdiL (CAAX protease family)